MAQFHTWWYHVGSERAAEFISWRGGAAIGTADGAICVWDARKVKLLATLMPLPQRRKEGEKDNETLNSRDWIAYTPEGYYTGSPGAEKYIHWRVGDRLYRATKYKSTFHRPDLVRKALRGG